MIARRSLIIQSVLRKGSLNHEKVISKHFSEEEQLSKQEKSTKDPFLMQRKL